ncbi:hypothetical protein D3C79_664890 [compost metagenome]
MHTSTAHLLFGYLLADCRFSQPRRTQVSSCLFVDHDDQVAQRWYIGRTRGRGAEHDADLGYYPRDLHLRVENVAPCDPSEVAIELTVDTSASTVHEVDDWHLGIHSNFLHANDFTEGVVAPSARFDSHVVCNDSDFLAVDLANCSYHGVARHSARCADKQTVLKVLTVVEEHVETVADQDLTLSLVFFFCFV